MNAAAKPGLGDVASTRPLSRAERRAAASRVHADQETIAPAPEPAAAEPPSPTPAAAESTTAPSVTIPMRRRAKKRPFSTQLTAETAARLDWLVAQGAVLTETVDSAITAYLDAAGVPRPGPDGAMPTAESHAPQR